MQQGQAQEGGLRLVFKSPSVPLLPGWVRRTAAGAKDRLLRYSVSALPAGFHCVPLRSVGACCAVLAWWPHIPASESNPYIPALSQTQACASCRAATGVRPDPIYVLRQRAALPVRITYVPWQRLLSTCSDMHRQ